MAVFTLAAVDSDEYVFSSSAILGSIVVSGWPKVDSNAAFDMARSARSVSQRAPTQTAECC
eukprot:1579020-Prymnesium_polylepis.1